VYPVSEFRRLYGKALPDGAYAVAEARLEPDWLLSAAGKAAAVGSAERTEAVKSAAVVLRLRSADGRTSAGVSALTALRRAPGGAAVPALVESIESLFGPMESATVCVNSTPGGLRVRAFLDFPEGSESARWIAGVGEPRADPLFATALGTPAAIVSVQLSPKVGREGVAAGVRRMVEVLKERGGVFPEGFADTLSAAVAEIVGATGGLSVVIGLPAGKDGTIGLRGVIEAAPGTDPMKALAGAIAPANTLLSAVLRPPVPPIVLRRTVGAMNLGGTPVDTLEPAIEGDSAAAVFVRSIAATIFGPEGFKLLLAPGGPGRTAFALACDKTLLEKTLAGPAAAPPAIAQRLAALPGRRHVTLLVSPGRLLFLGRRIQENALRLPEWKPTGFIAVGGRFAGRGMVLDIDVPWEEAEALAAYLNSRP
jgi:hypothetical protein